MDSVHLLLTSSLLIVGSAFLFGILKKYCSFELDRNSNHYGGELVADVLKAHNVSYIFTLCGGHISPILTASEKLGIRVIDVRHEASAVFAADAVSRLSGTVGVAVVTAGPGLTNTVTAVKNAQMAESPIVLLAGAAAGLLRGRGSLQDIDQLGLFRSICKSCKRANRVQDIIPVLCEAFYIACSDTPGPVLVEFPIDTLYPYSLISQHMKVTENPRTLRQKVMNCYLRFYLFRLFANGFITKTENHTDEVSQLKIQSPRIPLASTRQIEQLVHLVLASSKPIVVIGSQAMLPPVSAYDTAANVKDMGLPVYMSGMARGLLGRHHPLAFRHARRVALREADLIILAGCVCDFRLDYGRILNRRAKIVIINRNKKQLYLNTDYFWRPHLAVQADVGSTIKQVTDQLRRRSPIKNTNHRCSHEWMKLLKDREDERNEEIRLTVATVPEEHNNPLHVLWQLEHYGLLNDTEDSIIVADGGDFVASASYILRPRGPLSWLDPGPFGTLGVGAGFALGAKLCRPDATVWIIYGDGSVGYSLAEWDTFTRHKVGVIGLIGNDACWSQIARDQTVFFKSSIGCQLSYTPYEQIAYNYTQSLCRKNITTRNVIGDSTSGVDVANINVDGVDANTSASPPSNAFLVTKQNLKHLNEIFTKARESATQQHRPAMINCLIASSQFRNGSISV